MGLPIRNLRINEIIFQVFQEQNIQFCGTSNLSLKGSESGRLAYVLQRESAINQRLFSRNTTLWMNRIYCKINLVFSYLHIDNLFPSEGEFRKIWLQCEFVVLRKHACGKSLELFLCRGHYYRSSSKTDLNDANSSNLAPTKVGIRDPERETNLAVFFLERIN